MEAVSVRADTTSGETERTELKHAGADTSPEPKVYRRGKAAGTGRTIGTGQERLSILTSELVNCQTAGIKIKWMKSQTNPRRILIAVYDAMPCPKCNTWLLIGANGTIKCQTPGCEYEGVEHMPDDLMDNETPKPIDTATPP
jgi:hypothetical protein